MESGSCDMMLKAADPKWAPWYSLRLDDKRRAAELYPPPPEPDSASECSARQGQTAQALDDGRV